MRRSIRVRLLVWVLAVVAPLSLAAALLLIQVFGDRLLRRIDVALEEEAETVGALLAQPTPPDVTQLLLAHIAGETDLGPLKYITLSRGDTLVAEAPTGARSVLTSGDHNLRIARYEARATDGPLTVSVGVSAAAAVQAQRQLTSLLAIGTPAILLLLGGSLWLVIGAALRPLEAASRQLDRISAETLSVRVPVENPDDEVGRMVAVLNRMLDRLQHAVEELQRFTADAAHELRTPLTVLRAGLDVALTRERSAAEYHAALSEALTGTVRMCQLADDLLTLSRLEASSAPRAAASVDVSEMLHELADAWQEAAAGRGLTIALRVRPGLCISGNSGDIYRLFNNLIENAVRHSGERGQITLAAHDQGDDVETTVRDSGPGVLPQELTRIFDRFYRGNGARAGSGTGLGLSIAQEIARKHGGQIAATNGEHGGCVVTVTLPRAAQRL